MLTDRYLAGIPDDSRAARAHFLRPEQLTDQKMAVVRRLDEFAKGRGQSLASLALAWVLRQSAVTSVLIGASREAQILDAIAAANSQPLSQEELAAIEALLRKS